METITLPLPLVLCAGGFVLGILVTLALFAGNYRSSTTPAVVVKSEPEYGFGPGCGALMFLAVAAVAILAVSSAMGG